MIKTGMINTKKINGRYYTYYMYYDGSGKRITKYCGPSGKPQTKIRSLSIELDLLVEIKNQSDNRISQIKNTLTKLKNSIK